MLAPTRITLTILALVLAPSLATAGGGCTRFDAVSRIFKASDADGSGTLSRQEYVDAGLMRYGVAFEEYDADGDGEATLDEYLQVYDRYHRGPEQIES